MIYDDERITGISNKEDYQKKYNELEMVLKKYYHRRLIIVVVSFIIFFASSLILVINVELFNFKSKGYVLFGIYYAGEFIPGEYGLIFSQFIVFPLFLFKTKRKKKWRYEQDVKYMLGLKIKEINAEKILLKIFIAADSTLLLINILCWFSAATSRAGAYV